ncbi:hypothetical protein ACFQY4_10625 [Catellatospora bangladeshensis]|uniref:hypothetical protein n=1 Tax=Catellatospora bangladeshensis TaxID=310355 RepID=UPI003618F544
MEKALDDIHHVLAHDGVFALGMVEGDTDHLMRDFLGTPVPLTSYPREDLRHLLNRHGFIVEELRADYWEPAPIPTVPTTPKPTSTPTAPPPAPTKTRRSCVNCGYDTPLSGISLTVRARSSRS